MIARLYLVISNKALDLQTEDLDIDNPWFCAHSLTVLTLQRPLHVLCVMFITVQTKHKVYEASGCLEPGVRVIQDTISVLFPVHCHLTNVLHHNHNAKQRSGAIITKTLSNTFISTYIQLERRKIYCLLSAFTFSHTSIEKVSYSVVRKLDVEFFMELFVLGIIYQKHFPKTCFLENVCMSVVRPRPNHYLISY